MMRSMYSAVAGLRIHQTKMDVIGNNISNVNTIGFKSARVTFKEVFSQTISGATGSTAPQKGGTNPYQIGLGSTLQSIDVQMGSGTPQRTDGAYDLFIDGEGFFVVSDSSGTYFTRAGAFRLDVDGYLTDPNGLFVNGWDAVPDEANPGQQKINKVKATPIQIAADDNYIQPEMTTYIRADGNLNPYTEPERETSISFYDSLGTRYTSDVKFKFIAPGALDDAGNEIPAGDPRIGRWSVQMKNYMQVGTDNEKVLVGVTTPAASIPEGSDERAQLNSAITGLAPFGIMQIETQAQPAAGQEAPESWIDIGTISFTDMGNLTTYDTTATVPPPENPQIDAYMSSLVFTVTDTAETLAPESRFDETITWNFEDVTQFNGASTFTNITKDGNEPGTLSQVSIGADGILMGSYSNGSTKEIAQISIATFVNPTGLTKTGNNLFQSTRNSGEFDGVGKTVYDAGSTIMGGVLEMSNVDLGFEFTEMITAQRGFQANSRTITTSDEILQELVNLKR